MSTPIYQAQKTKAAPPKSKLPLSEQILHEIKHDLFKRGKPTSLAFKSFPRHFTFETQEQKEEIILLLRRHLITNIPWLLIAGLMTLAPLILPLFPMLDFLPANFQFMSLILWYMLVLAYILENFLSWYFNVYIVTDERVVDVDFFSLVYKRISEAKIENIEDVSYSQGGFIQSVFDFGTVNIQTAGESREFEFGDVPSPAQVAKVLNQLALQEEQEKIEGRVR